MLTTQHRPGRTVAVAPDLAHRQSRSVILTDEGTGLLAHTVRVYRRGNGVYEVGFFNANYAATLRPDWRDFGTYRQAADYANAWISRNGRTVAEVIEPRPGA